MESEKYDGKFFDYFMVIYDPRQDEKVKHKLIDVLFIGVCASICRCDDWEEMEEWAMDNEEWLKKYLELPNGIPSKYTLERVFDFIDPKQFQKCFSEWMKEVTQIDAGTVVAIDGKSMRGTSRSNGKKAVQIVSAWCSSNKMVLGQVKTDEKSNEITAVPELLELLCIKGCIVTVDALNTQKDIVKKIVEDKKADYVVALKENHPTLHREVVEYFKDLESNNFESDKVHKYQTKEKNHGRIEKRTYYYSTDIKWVDAKEDWKKLNGIGMVIREVTTGKKHTKEKAYHLGSVKEVKDYASGVRMHWGIESMHWSLDVTFREDQNRTILGKAPENLAMLKRLSLNMVKKDTEIMPKKSLKLRRFRASLKLDYLEYIFKINF